MEEVFNFKRKGGRIVWIEGHGATATHNDTPKKFLVEDGSGKVFRYSKEEWDNPPEGLRRAKGFL